jgi:hypothetical protein
MGGSRTADVFARAKRASASVARADVSRSTTGLSPRKARLSGATTGSREVTELAARAPVLPTDDVDVRPLMKGAVPADKEAKPGKIFACAVLGSAPSEEGWVEVMNRIDEETRGRFPEASFLGGLRLEPPRSGRRIATRAERRAMFDGPFLESKEVIGGLLLLRMTTIDEAVRWASETPFVVLGALEIRELWRI